MNKLLIRISYLTLVMAFIILGVVFYWLINPYTPIVFNDLPHKVVEKTIKSGGYLKYEVDYCKNNTLVPTISKSFIDGLIYTIPPANAVEKPKGCGKVINLVYVPKALPPGNYMLKITYKYQVNPIRTITVSTETEKFEVVK